MTTEAAAAPSLSLRDGWRYEVLTSISSTNTYAAHLPAWSAVRAEIQTGGRGRVPDRRWVSDAGGLWLSAVLPCPGERSRWAILPLAVGWAVIGALQELGVPEVRLRWPNDLMVGRRKLAGILVERYSAATATVGIGINVRNDPEFANAALSGETTRLSDLAAHPDTVDDVARIVLAWLRRMHGVLMDRGFRPIAGDLNLGWAKRRRVAVQLEHGGTLEGRFEGIDDSGRLRLVTEAAGPRYYAATEISLLRELEQ